MVSSGKDAFVVFVMRGGRALRFEQSTCLFWGYNNVRVGAVLEGADVVQENGCRTPKNHSDSILESGYGDLLG